MIKNVLLIFTFFFFAFYQALLAQDQKAMLLTVDFEQKIGAELDSRLTFIDENNHVFNAQDLLSGRPSLFVFTYSHCKTLCPLVLDSLVLELKKLKPSLIMNYNVIFLSIDPHESSNDLQERKKMAMQRYSFPADHISWYFLRAEDLQIKKAATNLGFNYHYDRESKQYAHPAGIVFLTPKGVVSSYLMGANFSAPLIASALKVAAAEKKGSLVEKLLLYCFHYDPKNSKYGDLIIASLRISGAFTLLFIFAIIYFQSRRKIT